LKFIVIGTSQFSVTTSDAILESGGDVLAIVSMPKDSLPNNSADLSSYSKSKNLNYVEINDINCQDSIKILSHYQPDFIFVSWPKILSKKALNIPKYFCVGSHPTDLPNNRGRHPLHWIIALGITETKLSFFKMDAGIDTGDLLIQVPFLVELDDDIEDLNEKMNIAAYEGTKKLCENFLNDIPLKGITQDSLDANYWRKRTPHDTLLDLRMPAELISRLVRSFTLPYPCATLIFKRHLIKISDVIVVNKSINNKQLDRIEPGKIISVKSNSLIVKVDKGIVELVCVNQIPNDLSLAKYIQPPSKYILEYHHKLD